MTDQELHMAIARVKRQRVELIAREESTKAPEVQLAWLERELEDRRNRTASVEMDEHPGWFL